MFVLLAQVDTVSPTGDAAIDFTWLFIKMLLVLGIVSVGAVLVLKYAVPRIGAMKRFQQGKCFSVLARYTLEPGKSLYLVNVGKRYLVLGAADHGISLLGEVTEEEALRGRDQ